MKSIDEKIDPMTLGQLKILLKELPKLEEELDNFATDLEEISINQPLLLTGDLWERKRFDEVAKSQFSRYSVIPAEAGIQLIQ